MVTLNLVDILMACMYRLLGMAVTFDPPSVSPSYNSLNWVAAAPAVCRSARTKRVAPSHQLLQHHKEGDLQL